MNNNMFIEPIKPITGFSGFEKAEEIQKKNDGMFASLVKGALGSMEQTMETAADNMTDVALGLSDNPSELIVDSTVASLTTSLVVQIRNKAIEAYNEITKMSV